MAAFFDCTIAVMQLSSLLSCSHFCIELTLPVPTFILFCRKYLIYLYNNSQSIVKSINFPYCVAVTFSQRSYSFGSENRGETVPFPITVSYFSGTGNYDVRLSINNNPNPLPSEFLLQ